MRRLLLSFLPLLLCLPALSAHALPGEAAAVLRHCGTPRAEHMGTSEVTNRFQRDLIYDDVTLHFVPDGSGWSFTTGWSGHFPITRSGLASSMPCFRDAMAEVAAQPQPVTPIDPTIAQGAAAIPITTSGFGVQHLGLIALLAVMLMLLLLWPRRQPAALNELPSARRLRKPQLTPEAFRRRPRRSLLE